MEFKIITNQDYPEAIEVFNTTFTESEGEEEGALIANLAADFFDSKTDDEMITYSAWQNKQFVAAIICSKMQFASTHINTFILAPVAVLPSFQKQGIATKLIEFAKADLLTKKVQLFITYGDPDFYHKVGFKPVTTKQIPSPHPLSMPFGWLAQTLDGSSMPTIQGQSQCVSALNHAKYW